MSIGISPKEIFVSPGPDLADVVDRFSTDLEIYAEADAIYGTLCCNPDDFACDDPDDCDLCPECGVEGISDFLKQHRDELRFPIRFSPLCPRNIKNLEKILERVWELGGSRYDPDAVEDALLSVAEEDDGARVPTDQFAASVLAQLQRESEEDPASVLETDIIRAWSEEFGREPVRSDRNAMRRLAAECPDGSLEAAVRLRRRLGRVPAPVEVRELIDLGETGMPPELLIELFA